MIVLVTVIAFVGQTPLETIALKNLLLEDVILLIVHVVPFTPSIVVNRPVAVEADCH